MGAPFTRVISWLAAASLLLSGCGFELFQTASRLASGNAVSALPSWPVDLKVGLGDATLPVSKLIEPGSSVPLQISDDKTYSLQPDAQPIPTVKVGDNLKVGAQPTLDFPPQTLSAPPLKQSFSGPTLTLEDLGVAGIKLSDPGPTIGEVIDSDLFGDPTPMPRTVSFQKDTSKSISLTDLRGAKLGNGSTVTLSLANEIGGNDQASMGLVLENLVIESEGTQLNQTWKASHPSVALTTGDLVVDLDPDRVIAGGLSISFTVKGQVPVGFNLKQLRGSQKISFDRIDADLQIKAISLPAKAFPPVTKDFDVTLPADLGIGAIANLKVATGSITLHLVNGFGVNASMSVALDGVKNAAGGPYVASFLIPAGGATPAIRDVALDLAGATIEGTHVGVNLSGQSIDTEAAAPEIPAELELPGKMAIYQADQSLSGSATVGALAFESVSATLNRTVPISSSSTPINLPKEIRELGIGFDRVSLQLKIANKSQLPGVLALDAKAVLPDNSTMPLTYTGSLAMAPAAAVGDVRTTVLDLNETNSNLIAILNAGAKELQFGGSVAINTGTTLVPLTRHDELSGQVAVSVPLSLIFPAMGLDQAVKPYDIKPASPLNLDAATKERLGQGLVSRFELTTMIDNGLHLPLILNLLFSKTEDPYADPAPLTKSLALGDGLTTQTSQIAITAPEMAFFQDAKTIGFRLTSPGTQGKAVRLRSTDELRIRLLAQLKLRVSVASMQGTK